MIQLLTVILILGTAFGSSKCAIILALLLAAFNILRLRQGFKVIKSDPVEFWKVLILNGGILLFAVWLLLDTLL